MEEETVVGCPWNFGQFTVMAFGLDNISARLLKDSANVISKSLKIV